MPNDAPPPRPGRLGGAIRLCGVGMILGLLSGALEGRWIAHRDLYPVSAFDPELAAIALHHVILFGGVGLLLGLAWRWRRPQRPACLMALAAAVWIIPFQAQSTTAMVVGLVVVAAACVLYLRSSVRLQRLWLGLDSLLGMLLLAGFVDTSAPPDPVRDDLPNIVMVVIDTLRSDHLSCYGHRPEGRPTTPNIDAVAAAGTRFERAFAQAPWTRPSVASLFTGTFAASHGIVTHKDKLGDFPTIATMLRARGYRTTAFSANPQVSPTFGFDPGFQVFWNSTDRSTRASAVVRLWRKVGIPLGLVAADPDPPRRGVRGSTADDVNDAVLRWLGDAVVDEPSFLYVHYLDPHDPYSAPEDLLGLAPGPAVDEEPLYASQKLPPFPLEGCGLPGLETAEMRELQRRYDTEIRFVDEHVGELLEELYDSGMLGPDDYLVITSDHGEEFHEHQQWQHGRSLFDEMIHVPLIVQGPGIPAGQVVPATVQLVDILPSIAAWSGAPPDFPGHGQDLFAPRDGDDAFAQRPRYATMWSLRRGQRSLIWIFDEEDATVLAYDLAVDPGETTPLPEAGGAAFADMRRRLAELFETAADLRRGTTDEVELDAEMTRRLQQLGYIDK
jgi:arylsulfatase A-like enzyme